MIVHQTNIVFTILAIFITLLTEVIYSTSTNQCNHYCGSEIANRTKVPYPFGFSSGCPIRLRCPTNGDVRIGEFPVQNFTSDYVLIGLPAKCNRSIHEIKQLIHSNYALTWRNNLLLQNCSSPLPGCMIPMSMMESRFHLEGCKSRINESINCYSEDHSEIDFIDYDNVTSTNCTVLFSSITIDLNNSTSRNSAVSLEFQRLELGWWMNGACRCVDDANCTKVGLAGGGLGYRCRCKEGFEGDGFIGGNGCRKVSNCNASRYMFGRCGGTARVGVLIGGVIAGAILMTVIALICFCIRKRSASLKNQMSAKRLLSEATGAGSSIPFFPYKEIERATNGFSEKQRLGTGAYGTVYAGKLHSNDLVAIKKIRHKDAEGIEQVMNEIKLLSSVSHPNLVRLLGCCIENDEQILVYEYMANGTLSQHLQRERGKALPWTIRLTIATETAHAISHLHTMNPPIYHRDIKSSNILLDYNYNSKVADFGLSRLGMTDDSHISTAPQGTPGYVDPQYHQNFHLSDKSDVYSFGVVLVEIITAQKVVDFTRPHSEINLAALAIDRIGKGKVDEIIDPFLDPNKDAWTLSSIHKVAELAFRCLAFHRDMRPTMMEVADELEQVRLSGWAPMEENMLMGSSVGGSSCCSSPYSRSEKSFGGTSMKKIVGIESRRLIVPQRVDSYLNTTMEEMKDSSPVSVQDPWLSEQSSPSTNSLLGNVAR